MTTAELRWSCMSINTVLMDVKYVQNKNYTVIYVSHLCFVVLCYHIQLFKFEMVICVYVCVFV